jgi:hypothetical protein
MKLIALVLALLLNSLSLADLGTFKDGLLIDPGTNEPFTGNIELINTDWNTVEFSQYYVNGLLHGQERGYYQSGRLKSAGSYKNGLVDGQPRYFLIDVTLLNKRVAVLVIYYGIFL